jgi:hypothetical protein
MSACSETNTPAIIYHACKQRDPFWLGMIADRIGGSRIGAASGLSKYQSPQDLVRDFHAPFKGERKFVDHGTAMEPFTDRLFRQWLAGPDVERPFGEFSPKTVREVIGSWKTQSATEEPGYITLDPEAHHPLFASKRDHAWFGVSLDYEGSVIDAEFKNPFTYFSFYKGYLETIDCAHFAQVQWAMAIRQRKAMFFVATSLHQEEGREEPTLLGMVIWYVAFAPKFFDEILYPGAVACAEALRSVQKEEVDVPWRNESGRYHASQEYKDLLTKYAMRVYIFKDGRSISRVIEQEKKKRLMSQMK